MQTCKTRYEVGLGCERVAGFLTSGAIRGLLRFIDEVENKKTTESYEIALVQGALDHLFDELVVSFDNDVPKRVKRCKIRVGRPAFSSYPGDGERSIIRPLGLERLAAAAHSRYPNRPRETPLQCYIEALRYAFADLRVAAKAAIVAE